MHNGNPKYTSVYRKKPTTLDMPKDPQDNHNLKHNSMFPPISALNSTIKHALSQVLDLALQPQGPHFTAKRHEYLPVALLYEDIRGNRFLHLRELNHAI
jgi:hypothetical protein